MKTDLDLLLQAVADSQADIAPSYDEWVTLCLACASLGENGRDVAHRLSQYSPKYSRRDTDRQFTYSLQHTRDKYTERTLFYLAQQAGVSLPRPSLTDYQQKASERPYCHTATSSAVAVTHSAYSHNSHDTEHDADDLYITPHVASGILPKLIEEAISIADKPATRDMALLSTLTAISYALPAFSLYHGAPKHRYQANLMTMVIAPPASGKGVMNWCRALLHPIHRDLKEEYRLCMADYQYAVQSQVAADKPRQQMTFIPVNASTSVFLQQINDNDGTGFAMATEMDTLSQAWGQDYGQYSDVFRCAFEHEAVSLRRRKEDEYFEIEHPSLSVLLSGTPNQLAPLIKSRANGLASRFACYVVRDLQPFDERVFDNQLPSDEPSDAIAVYDRLAKQVYRLWQWQRTTENRGRTCYFIFTDNQRVQLKQLFLGQYKAYMQQLGRFYDPTVKRMAVIIKRIGLIMSALRLDIGGTLPDKIYCSEEDFHVLLLIANKLMLHAALMFQMLPSPKQMDIQQGGGMQCQQLLESLPAEFTSGEACHFGKTLGIPERTVRRWLVKWTESNDIQKNARGQYSRTVTPNTIMA